MWEHAPARCRGSAIMEQGAWIAPLRLFGASPIRSREGLIEDGRRHLLLGGIDPQPLPGAHPAGHARPGRAVAPCDDAGRASRRRSRDADAGQGWRSPAVAAGGSGVAAFRLVRPPVLARHQISVTDFLTPNGAGWRHASSAIASARSVSGNRRRVTFQNAGE